MRSQLKEKTLTSICCTSQHSASFLLSCLHLLRSVFTLIISLIITQVNGLLLDMESQQDMSNIQFQSSSRITSLDTIFSTTIFM